MTFTLEQIALGERLWTKYRPLVRSDFDVPNANLSAVLKAERECHERGWFQSGESTVMIGNVAVLNFQPGLLN